MRSSEALALRDVFRDINLPPPVLKIAQVSLEDARLQMRDLKSPPEAAADGKSDHTMIQIPRFTVDRTQVDIDRQTVRIGEVAGRDGLFEIRRLGDGKLNLDIFLPPPDAAEASPAAPADPWQIDVQQVDLAGYAVNGVNLIPGDPLAVTVDEINLNVSDFSTRPDTQTTIALNCRINDTGRLETRTALTVTPLGADVQLGLEKVDLARFLPLYKTLYRRGAGRWRSCHRWQFKPENQRSESSRGGLYRKGHHHGFQNTGPAAGTPLCVLEGPHLERHGHRRQSDVSDHSGYQCEKPLQPAADRRARPTQSGHGHRADPGRSRASPGK